MMTDYGAIPDKSISQYLNSLVGKTFKILPLYEESVSTLPSYLKSYQRELIGASTLFSQIGDDPKFITLLSTIEYLSFNEYDHDVCKSEVLKCTNIIHYLNEKYFGGGMYE